jgi:3-methylcrotonyl-CoA carboxylase alpha subunit
MSLFTKILIANRGEIAVRIIRTCKRLGIKTVAVFSEADRHAYFVRLADEAYYIGEAPAAQSYLCGDKIIAVAQKSGAEAIHPGYGFLSENVEFAKACRACELVFIGPTPEAILAMALKGTAKALMQKAGVPVTPGFHGEAQDIETLRQEAQNIGYPILIKAVAGGGGKGMRRVDDPSQLAEALRSAQNEGLAAFKDPKVLLEKYIEIPRHIEIQLFADTFGNVVHLFERDCSLQRRHQKVIEEAPAPNLPEAMRHAMGQAAVTAAKAIHYVGAGTIEFIVDVAKGIKNAPFYFMEMNTRLQVEHPVTEAITGLDLVEWQLRVASGEPLPLPQAEIGLTGHAIEARLYAEDPNTDFLPSTGQLTRLSFPQTVRADSAVLEGDEVTMFYDPMIAKLIVHAKDRPSAIAALRLALVNTRVDGPKTNLSFLRRIATEPAFIKAEIDTGFIGRHLTSLLRPWPDFDTPDHSLKLEPSSPWQDQSGFWLNQAPHSPQGYDPKTDEGYETSGPLSLLSPMPGQVISLHAQNADHVEKGQAIVVLEAMKIQMTLKAPKSGQITGLELSLGQQIKDKTVVAIIT